MTLLVAMIADDLTGALDASAPFASRGLRTVVARHPGAVGAALATRAAVICVNTATREGTAADAAAITARVAADLAAARPRFAFKKIDSRLKGHLREEVAAARNVLGRTSIVVAPAIPDLGRFVTSGKVHGTGVTEPIDVRARCGTLDITVPDVANAGDWDALLDDAIPSAASTLLVGARGLAVALAGRLGQAVASSMRLPPPLPRPLLIGIGSRDPITRRQLDHLCATTPKQDNLIIVATLMEDTESTRSVAAALARDVCARIRQRPPAALLLSGGETAQAVLAELDVDLLDVTGDVLPGCPSSEFEFSGKRLQLVTKSGGFGTPETIAILAASPTPHMVEAVHLS